jgi:hypothetical protein
MSKKGQGPAFAEEVILHLRMHTSQRSSEGSSPHLKAIGMVMADLGLEKPPDFTDEEMNQIMFCAKGEAIRILLSRGRRVKRKRAKRG